jgi:hypothetical protein
LEKGEGMAEKEFFHKALADFAFDVASGGAIRHLADRGYTAKQIAGELDFSVPFEKVRQAVWDHLVSRQIILLDEPGSGKTKEKAVFVEERGRFGKKSFRRAVCPNEDKGQIHWIQKYISVGSPEDLVRLLSGMCRKNGRETAYMACDFGAWEYGEKEQYMELLGVLDERQGEYIRGLPWGKGRVFHRLDQRMQEIAGRMGLMKRFEGMFYFGGIGEKIIVGCADGGDGFLNTL